MRIAPIVSLAILLAAAPPGDDPVAQALAGYAPGEPITCLPTARGMSSRIVDGRTIIFRQSAWRLYRSDLSDDCIAARPGSIIVTQTPTGQLCRNDIVQIVDQPPGFVRGACPLGAFTPYTRARR